MKGEPGLFKRPSQNLKFFMVSCSNGRLNLQCNFFRFFLQYTVTTKRLKTDVHARNQSFCNGAMGYFGEISCSAFDTL